MLGVTSLQDHVSLNRNQAVELSAWKEATNGWPEVVWFLAEQECHPDVVVALLAEHLSSVVALVARFRTWNSTTVKFPAVWDSKSRTSQLGVVKELDVHPDASCA